MNPLSQTRGLLREIRHQEYLRVATAFGVHPVRIVLAHALRNALLPISALVSVEMPTALGGAFVVEKAFGIPGLGEETIRAVETHDVGWLVGIAFATALLATLCSILGDVAMAAIDPRLSRNALNQRRIYE